MIINHMPQADFKWLMQQAKDKKTKLLIKQIQKDQELIRTKGKFAKGKKVLNLRLGRYKIYMQKCGAPSSVDIYTEIFKEKGHADLPQFSGKGSRVIIDAGANEGFYTLKIKQNNPSAQIVAIEANPLAFKILKKNVRGNKLKNVILINKALASGLGKMTFAIVPEISALGALDIGPQKRPWLKKENVKKIAVWGTTLKKVCADNHIANIDILKLDVEGAEMSILKNSKDLLPNIKKIVVEYHTPKLKQEIKKFLQVNKFKFLHEKRDAGHCGDLYFIRR